MAGNTLEQDEVKFQQLYKKIVDRIKHIQMLTLQAKEECTTFVPSLTKEEANKVQDAAMRLDLTVNQFSYVINKIEDIEKQKNNKPLIIERN